MINLGSRQVSLLRTSQTVFLLSGLVTGCEELRYMEKFKRELDWKLAFPLKEMQQWGIRTFPVSFVVKSAKTFECSVPKLADFYMSRQTPVSWVRTMSPSVC